MSACLDVAQPSQTVVDPLTDSPSTATKPTHQPTPPFFSRCLCTATARSMWSLSLRSWRRWEGNATARPRPTVHNRLGPGPSVRGGLPCSHPSPLSHPSAASIPPCPHANPVPTPTALPSPLPRPRPAAPQIATVSADTAASFGITPRVAMMSYSTGTSGFGPQASGRHLAGHPPLWRLLEGLSFSGAFLPVEAARTALPIVGHSCLWRLPGGLPVWQRVPAPWLWARGTLLRAQDV